jgi:hypothetical protein
MELLSIVDTIVGYIQTGLEFVRDNLNKVAEWLPWDSSLTMTALFILIAIWVGGFIGKKYSTRPWSFPYALYTVIISIMVFLLLAYL